MRARSGVLLAIGALVASSLAAGCGGPTYDRQAMLGRIVEEVIVPEHDRFLEEARRLEAAAGRLAADPTRAALTETRERWVEAQLAWKGVELYQFEGLLLVHNAIEKRPPRAAFIEEAVADLAAGEADGSDPAFAESLGSTTKGLAAIEYLVFPEGGEGATPGASVLASLEDPARRTFLHALSRDLVRRAEELVGFWSSEGDGYGDTFRTNDSEGADTSGSISLLANNLIELCETTLQLRLGAPLGRTTDGTPRPDEVESPRSGRSLEMALARVEAMERVFHAGLDDYLDHLDGGTGEDRLSRRVGRRIRSVKRALRATPGPLRVAVVEEPEAVGAAYEEMRELLVLLKVDMAGQLGITVTFGDADGD